MTGIQGIAKGSQRIDTIQLEALVCACSLGRISTKAHNFKERVSISLRPDLESKLRRKAQAEGLTVHKYVERLIAIAEPPNEELENLALEGFRSSEAIAADSQYWRAKHRCLDELLKKKRAGSRAR
jgi:hypothetical protein